MPRRSLVRARKGPRRRASEPMVVADDWQRWVADNLLRGVEAADLVAGLRGGGVSESLARATVDAIGRSPGLSVARSRDGWARRLELVARLCAAVRPRPLALLRGEAPDAEELFSRYWEGSTPGLFTDIVPRWRRDWTPRSLQRRFGDVPIEACVGRERDSQPDANWREHVETMPLSEYVDRMLAVDRSNDLYLIANNRNTARPELRALWNDVVLPKGWFHEPRLPHGSALWLGPAGTVTPLHHDTSNILFCQVHGRKRVLLAPPWSVELLASARGVYNDRRGDDVRREGIAAIDVVMQPGEALFIPAGWWHDVVALDASVSLAINAFARDNTFGWYAPGSVRG